MLLRARSTPRLNERRREQCRDNDHAQPRGELGHCLQPGMNAAHALLPFFSRQLSAVEMGTKPSRSRTSASGLGPERSCGARRGRIRRRAGRVLGGQRPQPTRHRPRSCVAGVVVGGSRSSWRRASTTSGSNCVPALVRSSSAAVRGRERGAAIAAVGGHGLVGVADGDDARAEGDLGALEAVRVAGAVPSLVAGADESRDRT